MRASICGRGTERGLDSTQHLRRAMHARLDEYLLRPLHQMLEGRAVLSRDFRDRTRVSQLRTSESIAGVEQPLDLGRLTQRQLIRQPKDHGRSSTGGDLLGLIVVARLSEPSYERVACPDEGGWRRGGQLA